MHMHLSSVFSTTERGRGGGAKLSCYSKRDENNTYGLILYVFGGKQHYNYMSYNCTESERLTKSDINHIEILFLQ